MLKSWISGTIKYHTRLSAFSAWGPEQTITILSSEEMASTNHFPVDTNIDDGGPWLLHKEYNDYIIGHINQGGGTFYGDFSCEAPTAWSVTPVSEKTTNQLNSLGTTAIARSAPTNPLVNLASSGAETLGAHQLVDLPGRQLWRERALTARSAGKEYLNVEFGWLPLVSDITKAMHSVKHHTSLIRQYEAGSGVKTRVGYGFPETQTTKFLASSAFFPKPSSGLNQFGTGTITEQYFESSWFKGAFKYYVPLGNDVSSKLQRYEQEANFLLGTRLTPEVLWNATPWSWFADWFGTTGDVLHNISVLGHDGLVMQYGYIMNHMQRDQIASVTLAGQHVGFTKSTVWKKRLPATPYGFGINLGTLSKTQIAILAALGLSKGVPGFSH